MGDRLVEEGRKINTTTIWTEGSPAITTAYFPPLGKYTKYPFILAIAQHVTERILGDAAKERGIHVYRPFKVVDIKPNQEDAAFTDVIFEDGQVVRARCVVGADGSRSTVSEYTPSATVVELTTPNRSGSSSTSAGPTPRARRIPTRPTTTSRT